MKIVIEESSDNGLYKINKKNNTNNNLSDHGFMVFFFLAMPPIYLNQLKLCLTQSIDWIIQYQNKKILKLCK